MIYVMLVAALLFFWVEILHVLNETYRDWALHREMNKRGDYLRAGWTYAGSERLRGRLADAQDTLKARTQNHRTAKQLSGRI